MTRQAYEQQLTALQNELALAQARGDQATQDLVLEAMRNLLEQAILQFQQDEVNAANVAALQTARQNIVWARLQLAGVHRQAHPAPAPANRPVAQPRGGRRQTNPPPANNAAGGQCQHNDDTWRFLRAAAWVLGVLGILTILAFLAFGVAWVFRSPANTVSPVAVQRSIDGAADTISNAVHAQGGQVRGAIDRNTEAVKGTRQQTAPRPAAPRTAPAPQPQTPPTPGISFQECKEMWLSRGITWVGKCQ